MSSSPPKLHRKRPADSEVIDLEDSGSFGKPDDRTLDEILKDKRRRIEGDDAVEEGKEGTSDANSKFASPSPFSKQESTTSSKHGSPQPAESEIIYQLSPEPLSLSPSKLAFPCDIRSSLASFEALRIANRSWPKLGQKRTYMTFCTKLKKPLAKGKRVTKAKTSGEKRPIQRKVDHLWVCSTDIHCLSLSTCSRMVSFYKNNVCCSSFFLKYPCDQKINSYFSLDFKTTLTKH